MSSFFNFKKISKIFVLTFLLSGCATTSVPKEDRVNNSKISQIRIVDENTNSPLNGVSCTAISSKNRYIKSFSQPITTISSYALSMREDHMVIKCNKNGYHSLQRVIRATASDNKEMIKQSLVGGLVGAIIGGVPIYTPTSFVLPQNITLKMRKL